MCPTEGLGLCVGIEPGSTEVIEDGFAIYWYEESGIRIGSRRICCYKKWQREKKALKPQNNHNAV